jgi:hypothetical protein
MRLLNDRWSSVNGLLERLLEGKTESNNLQDKKPTVAGKITHFVTQVGKPTSEAGAVHQESRSVSANTFSAHE